LGRLFNKQIGLDPKIHSSDLKGFLNTLNLRGGRL